MPWCATCDRFLAPPTVQPDGTCPTCGRQVEVGEAASRRDRDLPPVPWHFKVLVGGLTVYLGYRAWQGVEWVRHTITH